jgi:hypothetical protein
VRSPLAIAACAALAACAGPPPVIVGGLTLDLVTPADVDPLEGADVLLVRVLDGVGGEIARGAGTPTGGVALPPIPSFGLVEVEVTARRNGVVLAAARSGPVAIAPGEDRVVDALFLPVNQAIPLRWTPSTARVGHAALQTPDARVLLVGGRPPSSSAVAATTEWWHPRLGYDGPGPALPTPQAQAGSAILADGSLLLAGGIGTSGPTSAVTVVSADGAAARALPALPSAADRACVAAHPTLGALVLAGGPVQVYTSEARSGEAADFSTAGITGCAGIGDRVLLAGQAARWGVLDLGQAVWPASIGSRFAPVGGMLDVDGPAVLGLPDGTGWVGGGFGPSPRRLTYRIDLDTRVAERGPDLALPRVDAQVAPWRAGAIVLAGGYADAVRSQPERSVEIFDPDAGSLVVIPAPVRTPTLSVLPGGTILLTGGLASDGGAAGAFGIVPWPDAP